MLVIPLSFNSFNVHVRKNPLSHPTKKPTKNPVISYLSVIYQSFLSPETLITGGPVSPPRLAELDKELGELAAGGPLVLESWEETKESWVWWVFVVAVKKDLAFG